MVLRLCLKVFLFVRNKNSLLNLTRSPHASKYENVSVKQNCIVLVCSAESLSRVKTGIYLVIASRSKENVSGQKNITPSKIMVLFLC